MLLTSRAKADSRQMEAKHFLQELLSILKRVHDHNMIHRDLKPKNIMIRRSSDPPSFVLLDFGLAIQFTPGVSFHPTTKEGFPIAFLILEVHQC